MDKGTRYNFRGTFHTIWNEVSYSRIHLVRRRVRCVAMLQLQHGVPESGPEWSKLICRTIG